MTTIASEGRSGAGIVSRVRGLVAGVQESAALQSVALLVARLGLGWVFMYHGAGKLFDFKHQGGIAGTTMFFQMEGIPAPHLFAYVVGATEFFGGLMIVLGLLVPLAGLALAIDMAVAILTSTGSVGMLPKDAGHGIVADGFEINLALGVLALLLAVVGAGRLSVDRRLGLARAGRPTVRSR